MRYRIFQVEGQGWKICVSTCKAKGKAMSQKQHFKILSRNFKKKRNVHSMSGMR